MRDLLKAARRRLADPRMSTVDLESDQLIEVHREILMGKPMLRNVFREFYETCRGLDECYLEGKGLRIELGSGSSFFKTVYPDIVSTDYKAAPHLDRQLDAEQMDLAPESVRAFYALNCFHHFSHPRRFLAELCRVLVSGGGCVLIEPYSSCLGEFLYRRMFDSETFDKNQASWDTAGARIMTKANQALSYIVFERDKAVLGREFPQLSVVVHKPLSSYLRYLLSGGLNFRQLVPQGLEGFLRLAETALSPLEKMLALHHVLVLKKNGG